MGRLKPAIRQIRSALSDSGFLFALLFCIILPSLRSSFKGPSSLSESPLYPSISGSSLSQSLQRSSELPPQQPKGTFSEAGHGEAEDGKDGGFKRLRAQESNGSEAADANKDDDTSSLSLQQRQQQQELVGNPVGRLKIFVYELPQAFNYNFIKKQPRCLTHMFALEVFFHRYILSSPVRTKDPEQADWFYLPVYPTCDLTKTGLPLPFRSPRMMRAAVSLAAHKWPFWNRTDGADHFFVTPHDFGACFHYEEEKAISRGILSVLRRSTLVQTFGQRHHVCHQPGSIVVPPFAPTGHMHKRLVATETPRSIFVYFRGLFYDQNNDPLGGYYARGSRASIWENFKGHSLFDMSAEHPASYYEDMQRSLFCLCPLGWAPWSPRLVESVFFGCIPVIIADGIVLPFADVIPWREIAVFVPEKDVPRLDEILAGIGPRRVLAMQQRLASRAIRQAVVLGHPRPQEGDVFHQVLNGLARKLPHPPSAYLRPGDERLNWTTGPANDFKPWLPDSHIFW